MGIDSTLAIRSYDAARRLAQPRQEASDAAGADGLSFSDALSRAAQMMEESLRAGETAMTAAASGSGDVQKLVEALSATELALETAVTVRDRVVEAYKEILRMPV